MNKTNGQTQYLKVKNITYFGTEEVQMKLQSQQDQEYFKIQNWFICTSTSLLPQHVYIYIISKWDAIIILGPLH
jgi:hypothetical protein